VDRDALLNSCEPFAKVLFLPTGSPEQCFVCYPTAFSLVFISPPHHFLETRIAIHLLEFLVRGNRNLFWKGSIPLC
jgi:hypothetical protein